MGQARGKLGNIVLARVNGQETQRSYNQNPRNPRTSQQMAQRAKLASVSEMYIRGTRNFFKYAFENKKQTNSEYNAFCSQNIGRVPANSREALKAGAPAIGNYIMTFGSLRTITINAESDGFAIPLAKPVSAAAFELWTVADLSAAFMASYACLEGDIITYLDIHSACRPYTSLQECTQNAALTTIEGTTAWDIKQFRIDLADSTPVINLGIFAPTSTNDKLMLSTFYGYDEKMVEGITVVCSRPSGSGVRVSTSSIMCNPATQKAVEIGMSKYWQIAVAYLWKQEKGAEVNAENILQGSLLSEPEYVDPATLPTISSIKLNGQPVVNGQSYDITEPTSLVITGTNCKSIKVSMGGVQWVPAVESDESLEFTITSSGTLTIVGDVRVAFNVTYTPPVPAAKVNSWGLWSDDTKQVGKSYWINDNTQKVYVRGENLGEVTAADVTVANGVVVGGFVGGETTISFTLSGMQEEKANLIKVKDIVVGSLGYTLETQL